MLRQIRPVVIRGAAEGVSWPWLAHCLTAAGAANAVDLGQCIGTAAP
jgi:hypothetical protein